MTHQSPVSVNRAAANFFASFLGDSSLVEALDDGRDFAYKPQKDITTYELSLCLYWLFARVSSNISLRDWQKSYDELPPEVQRHFVVIPLEEPND